MTRQSACQILLCLSTLHALQIAATIIPQDASEVSLYVMVTPSHEKFFREWFLPSLKDNYKLVVKRREQGKCNGVQMSPGWTKTVLKKVDIILEAIEENWGKPFVFSDVDIQFFRPTWPTLAALLKDNDMLFQSEKPPHKTICCTGFFVCVGNERTRKIWRDTKNNMLSLPPERRNSDQWGFNRMRGKNPQLKFELLPEIFMGGFSWKRHGHRVVDGCLMHHANFAKGTKAKIAQLECVRNKFLASNQL